MNEPLENSTAQAKNTAARPWKITLTEIIVVLSIGAMLRSLMLPFDGGPGRPHPSSRCLNHMRNVGIATTNYAFQNSGQLPHVNLVNDEGVALHSWRTTLLPYLDRARLYREIDLTQAWDSEENIEFSGVVLEVYQCPRDPGYRSRPTTNYFTVVGHQTPFPPVVETEKHPTGHITLDYVSHHDGQAQTLGLVEASGQNVWWAEPRDIPFSDLRFGINHENGRGVSSGHPAGAVNVIFLDGHGDSISKNIDPEVLRALCTIDNYENEVKFDDSDY